MNQTLTCILILMACLFDTNINVSGPVVHDTIVSINNQTIMENKLIYFGDPMCSWCYGFSPEMTKVKDALPEGVDFELRMGGLRPGGTETMADLKDFLKSHWVEIAEITGQPFKYEILEQSKFVYDTEPSCRAVVIAKEMAPEKSFTFFKEVQKMFYAKNEDTKSVNTYLKIVEKLKMDSDDFESRFKSTEAKAATQRDFEYSGSLGVNSFPTLVLKKGEQYHLLSQGYAKSEAILKAINQILNTNSVED